MSWSVSCVVFIGMKLAPPELFKVLSDVKPLSKSASVHRFFLCISLLVLFASTGLHAQWSTDPSNNLIVGYGLLPEMCSDSTGGAYVTYEVSSTYPRHIALRRLNRYGYQPWNTSIAIQGAKPESRYASLASDGQNGLLIAFLDREWNQNPIDPGYNDRVRVQRVDSSGNLLWGGVGLRVSTEEHTQSADSYVKIVGDGTGGSVVMWLDTLNMIKLQRITANGIRAWGDTGVMVETRQTIVTYLVGDAEVGFIAYVGGGKFHRVDSTGAKLWGPNGVTLQILSGPIVSADLSGGAILAGTLVVGGYRNAKCQRIDSTGTVQWGENGITLADSLTSAPQIVQAVHPDRSSVFAWTNHVSGNLRSFSQRVRGDGTIVFIQGGVQISEYSASNGPWALIPSTGSSTVCLLADSRFGGSLFAQRLDSIGVHLWNDTDNVISSRQLGSVKAATDNQGGIIAIGFDQSDFSVRAQQVSLNGILGEIVTYVKANSSDHSPMSLVLYQNYPNPFNSGTQIRFQVAQSGRIKLEIFNTLGQRVRTLVDGYYQPGNYHVSFMAGNLVSGMYLYRIHTKEASQVRKLVIIK